MKSPTRMRVPTDRHDSFVAGIHPDTGAKLLGAPGATLPPVPAGPMKRLTIDIPEDIHLRFRMTALRRKATMAKILLEAVESYLREHENP